MIEVSVGSVANWVMMAMAVSLVWGAIFDMT